MSRWNRNSINVSFSKKRPTNYQYIQAFEDTLEKECKRCDKNNDLIYAKNISLYMEMVKLLNKKNAIFNIMDLLIHHVFHLIMISTLFTKIETQW